MGYLLIALFAWPAVWAVMGARSSAGEQPGGSWRAGLSAYWPWTDDTGRRPAGLWRTALAGAFVLLYLVVSWALFVPLAEPRGGKYWIDEERVGAFVYRIPDLTADFPRALRPLVTAPFLNHDSIQLVYVTLLALLFGLVFEIREGTRTTALLFFGTSFAGAVVAGVLLHVIYPELAQAGFLERAWTRTWSGGSAGCFGLMGALAARARRPGPLLTFFVIWELNIAWWNLRSYTPAFHLTALVVGFVLTRYVIAPARIHESGAQRAGLRPSTGRS
ncbi:MAG: rhomboid family intramembrane serine protease [Chloroflexota bacterium]|nr:rhomboid family intramembrane serine protease [Chloroflexota bacterium]